MKQDLEPINADPVDDDKHINHYRAIWISDTHLGTVGCQADSLLDFLKHNRSDTLYLVGDIIDGWQLKKNWYWPQSHNDVIQKILRQARKGCRVIYVPGNHDEGARQFAGLALGGIPIVRRAEHVLLDGRRLLVIHGDEFDNVIRYAKWLAYLGDTLYTFTLFLNRIYNKVRTRLGYSYWSLSRYLKHQVKNAVSFILDFEVALIEEARRQGFDGVVCGHIHHAEIKDINGMLYCNDGDWVESLTALVETTDGQLDIIHWPHTAAAIKSKQAPVLLGAKPVTPPPVSDRPRSLAPILKQWMRL